MAHSGYKAKAFHSPNLGARRGNYRFTPGRRAALARAQRISAQKRKQRNGNIAKAAGIIAAVGATAYLGHKHSGTISRTAGNWKNAVSPKRKEEVRKGNAISVAHPSSTTVIGRGERARAQMTRDKLAKDASPPRYDENGVNVGGPDRHIYHEDGSVNQEAMTARSTSQTMRRARQKTRGSKTTSLKGTPGGTAKPAQAAKSQTAGLSDADYDAIYAADLATPHQPQADVHISRTARGASRDTLSIKGVKIGDENTLRTEQAFLDSAGRPAKKKRA